MAMKSILLLLTSLPVILAAPVETIFKLPYTNYPSHSRKMQLYSRNGFLLAIFKNGTIGSTYDRDSPDGILEMESYGVTIKKIRRAGSWYLAIDKNGKVRTRRKRRPDTYFIEHHIGDYVWYESLANGYVLSMKRNGTPKQKALKTSKHKRKTHFITLGYPYYKPTSDV